MLKQPTLPRQRYVSQETIAFGPQLRLPTPHIRHLKRFLPLVALSLMHLLRVGLPRAWEHPST